MLLGQYENLQGLKIFKRSIPIKIGCCFIYIFDFCFTVMPNFTDIYWRKKYPNINSTINYIMMIFLKNRNIDSMIWNHIFVWVKYKVYTRHRIIYNMGWFINNWCISCQGYERVNLFTWSFSNVIFPPTGTTSIKISCDNGTYREFIIYIVKK